jgi:hypothetical protein
VLAFSSSCLLASLFAKLNLCLVHVLLVVLYSCCVIVLVFLIILCADVYQDVAREAVSINIKLSQLLDAQSNMRRLIKATQTVQYDALAAFIDSLIGWLEATTPKLETREFENASKVSTRD